MLLHICYVKAKLCDEKKYSYAQNEFTVIDHARCNQIKKKSKKENVKMLFRVKLNECTYRAR